MSIRNKLIFFGAGASFGSEFIKKTPPIGENLFEALAIYDKEVWGSIPEKLAQDFKPDFEYGMVKYGDKNPKKVAILQRSMACYFFCFEPGPLSLYKKLAKRIIKAQWNGTFSTVNYDRLLQLSLTEEGFELTPDGFGFKFKKSGVEIKLILPHGSCNLFDENVKSPGNMVFDYRHFTTSGLKIRMVRAYNEFKIKIQNKILPIMCYYEPLKRVTAGRVFIKDQRKKFEDAVLIADIICIIGVKVNKNDEHIWRPLTETKGRLLYCSGEEAGEEFEEWKKYNRKNRKDKIIKKLFEEGFKEICEALEI